MRFLFLFLVVMAGCSAKIQDLKKLEQENVRVDSGVIHAVTYTPAFSYKDQVYVSGGEGWVNLCVSQPEKYTVFVKSNETVIKFTGEEAKKAFNLLKVGDSVDYVCCDLVMKLDSKGAETNTIVDIVGLSLKPKEK